MSTRPSKLEDRIARTSTIAILSGVLVLIVLAALFYYFASPGHGIVATYAPHKQDEEVRFADCLYFSVVTLTSLGYGDHRPLGLSRFVAAFEVLLGIAIVALLVSKFAAARDSALISRVFIAVQRQSILNKREWVSAAADRLEAVFVAGNAAHMRSVAKELQHRLVNLRNDLRASADLPDTLREHSVSEYATLLNVLNRAAGVAGGVSIVGRTYGNTHATVKNILKAIAETLVIVRSVAPAAQVAEEASRISNLVDRQEGLLAVQLPPSLPDTSIRELRDAVLKALGAQPWSRGLHRRIARDLGLPPKLVFKIIRDVRER